MIAVTLMLTKAGVAPGTLAYATRLALQARYHDLLAIVADWLSTRTQHHWTARRLLKPEVWRQTHIEVRTALAHVSGQTLWGLQIVTRDPRLPSRDWRLELALRDLEQGGVQATVVVYALDAPRFGEAPTSVPLSQPALVRALLERGAPVADTPGLHPIALDSEADARRLVARLIDPGRAHSLLVLCRGEATLDLSALSSALIGLAECVELRPVLSPDIAAVLKAASAWPSPARVALFPPRPSGPPSAGREPRLLLAAQTRTLTTGVLKVGAPRVLAEHVTVERLQQAGSEGALNDSDV